MADIVTGTVSGQLDITSLLQDNADIRRETAKEASDVRTLTAQSAYNVSDAAGNNADRIVANDTALFIANTAARTQSDKEVARSQAWMEASMNAGFVKIAGDQALSTAVLNGTIALEAAKLDGKVALGHALLGQQIINDGAATRALINDNRFGDQNRMLIERQAALLEAHGDARHWQHGYGVSQNAALVSQINALGSQLQETRQGINNFGSMAAGAGTQTSTSNNA
jgi:hypothetical protein